MPWTAKDAGLNDSVFNSLMTRDAQGYQVGQLIGFFIIIKSAIWNNMVDVKFRINRITSLASMVVALKGFGSLRKPIGAAIIAFATFPIPVVLTRCAYAEASTAAKTKLSFAIIARTRKRTSTRFTDIGFIGCPFRVSITRLATKALLVCTGLTFGMKRLIAIITDAQDLWLRAINRMLYPIGLGASAGTETPFRCFCGRPASKGLAAIFALLGDPILAHRFQITNTGTELLIARVGDGDTTMLTEFRRHLSPLVDVVSGIMRRGQPVQRFRLSGATLAPQAL